MTLNHLSPRQRDVMRDTALRLHALLSEVRRAPRDARDFALFEQRDALADLGVELDRLEHFDARDEAALDAHIAECESCVRALGHVDCDEANRDAVTVTAQSQRGAGEALDFGSSEANIGEYERWDSQASDFLMPVGNPANPGLRRQWEAANGRPWPKTATGRNYDVAHKQARADGGKDVLDNIEPMHPDDHRNQHKTKGDFARFWRRGESAKGFGGKVLPYGADPGKIRPPTGKITPRATLRGLGILSILPDITGIISGRTRIDSFDNFVDDMMGPVGPDFRRSFTRDPKPGKLIA